MVAPGDPWPTMFWPLMEKSPLADHAQFGWNMPMVLMLHSAEPELGAVPSNAHTSVLSGRVRWWVGVATNFFAMNVNGIDSQRASSPLPMHNVSVVCVELPMLTVAGVSRWAKRILDSPESSDTLNNCSPAEL